jgi:hypothetical protein
MDSISFSPKFVPFLPGDDERIGRGGVWVWVERLCGEVDKSEASTFTLDDDGEMVRRGVLNIWLLSSSSGNRPPEVAINEKISMMNPDADYNGVNVTYGLETADD